MRADLDIPPLASFIVPCLLSLASFDRKWWSPISLHSFHRFLAPQDRAMFDVSWDDPTKETVGQRKNRIEHDQNTTTPGLQRASTSSDTSTKTKSRPSLLTLLNGSRKDFSRPTSRAKVSALEKEPVRRPSRSRAGGVGVVTPPIPELPPGTLASDILVDRFVMTEFPESKDRVNYSPSDGVCLLNHPHELNRFDARLEPAFVSWASRSASTDSTWSSTAESPRRSNFVQPLSPTSFVTQRTEITVASREDANDNEQHIAVVHISADGKGPSATQGFPPQR
jgi:hypothetical protein